MEPLPARTTVFNEYRDHPVYKQDNRCLGVNPSCKQTYKETRDDLVFGKITCNSTRLSNEKGPETQFSSKLLVFVFEPQPGELGGYSLL